MACSHYYNHSTVFYTKKLISNGHKNIKKIFEQMKKTISHKLELTMPDTTKPFYIITDASNTGIGAGLLQQHPTEKKMKLVSANSRLFTPIEMRRCTLIRECSAIIFALTEY